MLLWREAARRFTDIVEMDMGFREGFASWNVCVVGTRKAERAPCCRYLRRRATA